MSRAVADIGAVFSPTLLTIGENSVYTGAPHLAGIGIDPLAGDLSSMLIKSHYDAHQGPPQAPRFERLRGHTPRLS
jgi:hypothetical protein